MRKFISCVLLLAIFTIPIMTDAVEGNAKTAAQDGFNVCLGSVEKLNISDVEKKGLISQCIK